MTHDPHRDLDPEQVLQEANLDPEQAIQAQAQEADDLVPVADPDDPNYVEPGKEYAS